MRGSLGLFSLIDLLQLLGANRSQGYLAVHHPAGGEGRVYFREGRVVHAAFDGLLDREALSAMLRDERGNFEFVPNRAAASETVTASLDNLLLAAIRGLTPSALSPSALSPGAPTEEREVPLPSETSVPRVLEMKRLGELTLCAEEFSVIEHLGRDLNVSAIAAASGLALEEVQAVLVRLASLGVLEVKQRPPRVARLVLGMSREVTGLAAYLDGAIMDAWGRQHGRPVPRVRLREVSGRETVLSALGAPGLGPHMLLSQNGLMRYSLSAGASVLVKPEV